MDSDFPFIAITVIVVAVLFCLWLGNRVSAKVKQRGGLFKIVYDWQYGLSYLNGRFAGVLPAGRYLNLSIGAQRDIFVLHNAEQFAVTAMVDLTSADKLVFRAAAQYAYRIVDPRVALEEGYAPKLGFAVSAALLKIAAERSLESFLAERATLDTRLLELLDAKVAGCEFRQAAIYSTGLPPEIRRMYAEVERARIEGQAALERARGEHASLRSLANAARMLKGNPELMNLRVLQALPHGRSTIVLGQNFGLPMTNGEAPSDAPGGAEPNSTP